MAASKAILSCLVVSLLGVLAPLANAQTTTLNFDSGAGSDTSSSPGYVNASVYFATYGINMSSITPGTQVVIINNNALYGGTATVPPSPPNLLTQSGLNTAISFTLNFPNPLTNISFTRVKLIASTPSGVTHPQWSAHAINSQGVEAQQVGEGLIASFTDVPARTFTLTGIDITSLRFDSNGLNFAGFSGVLLDNLVIAPFSPPAPVTSCVPDTWTACVLNNRFQARLRVRNHFANPQYDFDASVKPVSGFASAQSETAFFHFGDANNIELLVKLLNAGNSGIAVLYGVATPFELWMTITDTRTGAIQTYHTARDAMNGQTQFGAFPLDPSPTNFTFTAEKQLGGVSVGDLVEYSFCRPPITGNALCSSPPATNPTGGLSPYHFQLGSGVGFPPIGLTLALNGILSGTPTVAGPSTFQVCAVDLAANSACSTVTLTIDPRPTPPPSSNFYANWDCQNQSQCVDVMGHNQGSAGPFCSSTACDAWRQTFFFGATCTAQPVYPIYYAPAPGTCSNYPN